MNYFRIAKKHNIKAALKSVKADTLRFKWEHIDNKPNPVELEKNIPVGKTVLSVLLPGENPDFDNYYVVVREGFRPVKGTLKKMAAYCSDDADIIYPDIAYVGSIKKEKIVPRHIVRRPDYSPEALEDYNYFDGFYIIKKDVVFGDTEKLKAVHVHEIGAVAKNAIRPRNYPDISVVRQLKSKVSRDFFGQAGNREAADYPLVSIIIPNCEHMVELATCINSIRRCTYPNWEIVIAENNSESKVIFDYYDSITKEDSRIKLCKYGNQFNYSAVNNFAVANASGEYIILLNNDTEVITPDWIENMLKYASKPKVGAVGALLLYPDDTVQHCGVIVGIGPDGTAVHPESGAPYERAGYRDNIHHVANYSAVTGACLMVKKELYLALNGLDTDFAIAYNDIDFCLRLIKAGYRNVYTPYSILYHYESATRGDDLTGARYARHQKEAAAFRVRWQEYLACDPYYSPHLSRSIPWGPEIPNQEN